MGMAASQARLLTITARLADNELRSQTINNAKMRLASQSSQASANYVNALNNATLKFSNYDSVGNPVVQDLTYNALTAYSSYNTQYGLINSAGQILVSEEEAAIFAASNENLNAYLKKHGLEYTTTYFKELGAVENSAYPVPFDYIGIEEMQSYYEQYNSYENSKEVEDYERNYKKFVSASNLLGKAAEQTVKEYLTTPNNQTPITVLDNSVVMQKLELIRKASKNDGAALSGMLNHFKNAFTNEDNSYNIHNLHNKGYISERLVNQIQDFLDSMTYGNKVDPATGQTVPAVTTTKGAELSVEEKTVDGVVTTEWMVDNGIKLTVDANGFVTALDSTELEKINNDADNPATITVNYPKDNAGNLTPNIKVEDFINQLSFNIQGTDDGEAYNDTYSYHYDATKPENQRLSVSYDITDPDVFNTFLNTNAEMLITTISSSVNAETFAKDLLNMTPEELKKYNINPNSKFKFTELTLKEILDQFMAAKDAFLSNIFDDKSIDTVLKDIQDGNVVFTEDVKGTPDDPADDIERIITYENLTDIDFVLKYVHAKGGDVTLSKSFNTVIKEYLVDKMIEEKGEPKYAWVDENDPSAKGNADAKAQWYTNLFNRMRQGYKALENGLAASKEWMEYALESGLVTLEQVNKSFIWKGLDYKTCSVITEATDDAAVTAAEAEYNRAMNDIQSKDHIYDMQLKNIDTEHSSLQTEYDSIKGVIDKNIARTFKFNQSA